MTPNVLAPQIIGENFTNRSIILKDGEKNIYQGRETCNSQGSFRTRAKRRTRKAQNAPAVNIVHISYVLPQNRQVFLYLTNLQDGSMHFVEISSSDFINLDLSNYTAGFYSIAIVIDGQVQDSKNMIIQNQ